MLVKKIIIFVLIFVVACCVLILFKPANSVEDNYLKYQLQEYAIDTDKELDILVSQSSDNVLLLDRIEVVENDELTDSVVIYRYKLYDANESEFSVEYGDNKVKIQDYLGPLTIYKSASFLTNLQFDYGYFDGFSSDVYEVHIPSGIEYTLEGN
ncbi:MAG: hypothetical protein KAQ68_02845 [Clostridiales bacterium]|nr:hypothetical protein [Clostridiales bacterium]